MRISLVFLLAEPWTSYSETWTKPSISISMGFVPIPLEFQQSVWEYDWQLTARALLHYTEGLIPKSAISKETGINQQQLTHYASGYRIPRPAMRKRILDGIHSIAARLAAIT